MPTQRPAVGVFRLLCPLAASLLLSLSGIGCERGPLERICTPLEVGDLAISEIRGTKDAWGQWIELYNPTGQEQALVGLKLRLTNLDGSDLREILVRDHDLRIGPGGYVVLGRFAQDAVPAHVDYGAEVDFDFDLSLYDNGVLQVLSCDATAPKDPDQDRIIDQIVYQGLPSQGSLGFDGALALTAQANDEEDDWCVDATEVEVVIGDSTQVLPAGTPGELNRECP